MRATEISALLAAQPFMQRMLFVAIHVNSYYIAHGQGRLLLTVRREQHGGTTKNDEE